MLVKDTGEREQEYVERDCDAGLMPVREEGGLG